VIQAVENAAPAFAAGNSRRFSTRRKALARGGVRRDHEAAVKLQ
jgi:hypothetical protein